MYMHLRSIRSLQRFVHSPFSLGTPEGIAAQLVLQFVELTEEPHPAIQLFHEMSLQHDLRWPTGDFQRLTLTVCLNSSATARSSGSAESYLAAKDVSIGSGSLPKIALWDCFLYRANRVGTKFH